MVYVVGPYFILETEGEDVEHTDQLWEQFQAVIEGWADFNG